MVALLAACGTGGLSLTRPTVDVNIVNLSSRDLSNAEVRFGEQVCQWGFVSRGSTAAYLFYPHPITAQAELHWVDIGPRMQPMNLAKIYPRGKSGRLTFTVHNDRAEATFREDS